MTATKRPLISICITNYNYGQYLEQSIKSVLDQPFKDFEIIIMDDNSTDGSKEIIKRYCRLDKRVRGYFNKKNLGNVMNINRSITVSRGRYVMPFCADDYFAPGALLEYAKMIEKYPAVEYVFSKNLNVNPDCKLLFKNEHSFKPIRRYDRKIVPSKIAIKLLLYSPGNTQLSGILFRREVFDKYKFSPDHIFCQDWHFNIKVALMRHKIGYIDSHLIYYRIHNSNLTKRFAKKNQEEFDKFKMFEEYYPQVPFNDSEKRRMKANWFYAYAYKTLYSIIKFPRLVQNHFEYLKILRILCCSFTQKITLMLLCGLAGFDFPKKIGRILYVILYRKVYSRYYPEELLV